jgi:hypothetical protein
VTEIPEALVEQAVTALRQRIHVGTEVDVELYARAVFEAVLPDVRRAGWGEGVAKAREVVEFVADAAGLNDSTRSGVMLAVAAIRSLQSVAAREAGERP